MKEFKTYVKAARIKPDCSLDTLQKFLKAIGESLQYGEEFKEISEHKNWGFKTFKEGEDTILSVYCKALTKEKEEQQ